MRSCLLELDNTLDRTNQIDEEKANDMKEVVKDEKVDSMNNIAFENENVKNLHLQFPAVNVALQINDSKKRTISDLVDTESQEVKDLEKKKNKTKDDADLLSGKTKNKWLDDIHWLNCGYTEPYEDDDCYCPVCQGTCTCVHGECNCSRH